MTFYQINNPNYINGYDRQPEELGNGHHVVRYESPDPNWANSNVRVPFSVVGETIRIKLAEVEGNKRRVELNIPLDIGHRPSLTLADLEAAGIASIAIRPIEGEHGIFSVTGTAVEWWKDAESANLGHEVKEVRVRGERGF